MDQRNHREYIEDIILFITLVRSTLANHFHYYHNINLRYNIMLLIQYFTQYSHKSERVVKQGRALIDQLRPK